jgi:polysaccharide pyruvyl transferase WcaK-like protein
LKPDKYKKLLILGGDTDDNIGDRAIVYSMCNELRNLDPRLKISILSNNPARDRVFFGATAIPRSISHQPEMLRNSRSSNLVLIGGGGLFQDDDSLVKMPYWGIRTALLKAANPKGRIIGYSLGVGPLNKPVSRLFARIAFSCMETVSVRDDLGKKIASSLTKKPIHLVPDPALTLPSASKESATKLFEEHNIPIRNTTVVGVALRRWFHQKGNIIPHRYAVNYRLRKIPGSRMCEKMIGLLAAVLDRIASTYNAVIVFLPTYTVSHEADDEICRQTMAKMVSRKKHLLKIKDPMLYKSIAGQCSALLGGRMHPTIFAASAGTNIVGLSYNQKFFGLFKLLDLEDNVISIEDFVSKEKSETLFKIIAQAIKKRSDIKHRANKLAERTRTFNQMIIRSLL